MSYKTLYRKHRPKNFNQVIGQEHIITTLRNIIKVNKISHAYLFSGPRGIGKTSVAYIFANEINKKIEGNDDVYKMNFDIIEIDAASNNGVSEIRNLIDNSHYAPTNSKYKVYIIDEVHMLTKGAFNALLKTLEEPLSHLVFILATTEPHKIPMTILSRVQRFNFRRINNQLITQQLKNILDKEKIIYEEEAIKFASRLAQGGMRDALTIVEQAASYGNNKISFVSISQIFGIISIENQIEILNLIYQKKTKELFVNIENLINNGINIEKLINSLVDIIKDFIIYKKTNDLKLCSILSNENIDFLKISIPFAYEAINEFINIFKYIKFSEMKKQVFEISLLKLISFSNQNNNNNNKNLLNQKENENICKPKDNTIELKESSNITKIEKTQNNILENEQQKLMTHNIEEHIISTQDIPLNEVNENDSKLIEEVDLVSYFDSKKIKNQNNPSNQNIINMNEWINYLQHVDNVKKIKFKNLLSNDVNWMNKTKNKHYISLIQKSIFISGGEKFIILSSKDEEVVESLKNEANKQEFIDFIGSILEEFVNIIVISEDEFKEVKLEWKRMILEDQLPKKYPIKDVAISKQNKSNAEQLGEDLFGELFNK